MGANTALSVLERLREGFWVRDDATEYEANQGRELSASILGWIEGAP
jgi:hypothetical protein